MLIACDTDVLEIAGKEGEMLQYYKTSQLAKMAAKKWRSCEDALVFQPCVACLNV